MRKVLFIAGTGIGENMRALPTMFYLQHNYDLHVACSKKNYGFLKRLGFHVHLQDTMFAGWSRKNKGNYTEEALQTIKNGLNGLCKQEGIGVFAYPMDYSGFQLPEYKPNAEDIADVTEADLYLSASGTLRSYLHAGGPFKDFEKYNSLLPQTNPETKRIVLYKGSRNKVRSFPLDLLNAFKDRLKKKFSPEYQIVVLCPPKEFQNDPDVIYIDDTDPDKIMDMFEEGMSLYIGPDSGLSWMAQAYNVTCLFLEGMIHISDLVLPTAAERTYEFRRAQPKCAKTCYARTRYENKEARQEWNKMDCRNTIGCIPCLSFSATEYNSIIKLAEKILSKDSSIKSAKEIYTGDFYKDQNIIPRQAVVEEHLTYRILLPKGFDVSVYRALNPDIAHKSDSRLIRHFCMYGRNENRPFKLL